MASGRTRFEPPDDAHARAHGALLLWSHNVGAPVAIDLADEPTTHITGVDLLCWNVAVGAGRLDALLDRLRRGACGGVLADPARPLVVLLQEAYRHDASVPPHPATSRGSSGRRSPP